ncbi:MAG: hypothetical protein ACM3L9_09350, partial [Deltaproteobacteria bacterium]
GSGNAPPAAPAAPSTPPVSSAPPVSAQPAEGAKPFVHPAALAAMANAGLVADLEARASGGKPIPASELANLAQLVRLKGPEAYGARPDDSDGTGR